jgi:cation transport ATPase
MERRVILKKNELSRRQRLTFLASVCFMVGELATLCGYNWGYDQYGYFCVAYSIYIIFAAMNWSPRWGWAFFAWSVVSHYIGSQFGATSHWEYPDHLWWKVDALVSLGFISAIVICANFWHRFMSNPHFQILYWLLFTGDNDPAGLEYRICQEEADEEEEVVQRLFTEINLN